MKKLILGFYNNVARKKAFWIPLLILVMAAYGFSTFQRTISWDDLSRDRYIGSGHLSLSGRWGMILWAKLMGVVDYSPYIDRFLGVVFLILACALACVVLYKLKPLNKVWPYTVFASAIATYPLINEIWEFNLANFVSTANMCLVALTLLLLLCDNSKFKIKTAIIGSLLLALPVSSYESSVFYYLLFFFIILFYKTNSCKENYSFASFVKEGVVFAIPVIGALLIRVIVTIALLKIYDLSYNPGGASSVYWDFSNIAESIRLLIMRTGFFYGLAGLVYPPIALLVICIVTFSIYTIIRSVKEKKWSIILFGIAIISVLFIQAVIQGDSMPYRTAAFYLALFVAFLFYTLCEIVDGKKVFPYVVGALMFICWQQSTYMNKIQSLNNLRSDNELSALRQVGYRLSSEVDPSKPVVFVTSYKDGEWVNSRCRVGSNTWNGRLFSKITHQLMGNNEGQDGSDLFDEYKYIKTNIQCFTGYYHDLTLSLSYLGFNINIMKPAKDSNQEEYRIFEEAIKVAQDEKMRPYSIREMDNYVIATLSDDCFFDSYGY